jgi:hypothetical protein
MQLLFLVAGLLTLAVGVIFLGSFIIGIVLCFMDRLRPVAPFVLFIPSMAALGAAVGSWGLGYLAYQHDSMSVLPLWAWLIGFPAGAALGFSIGLGLALLTRKRFLSHGVTLQTAVMPNA